MKLQRIDEETRELVEDVRYNYGMLPSSKISDAQVQVSRNVECRQS